jgi:hypothetical protein
MSVQTEINSENTIAILNRILEQGTCAFSGEVHRKH